jgi:hypothetical protein
VIYTITLCFLLFITQLASAATYYVSTGGHGETLVSDSNSCTTAQNISTPKRTVTNAINNCLNLASGNVLQVRAGTYDEYLSNFDVPVLNWPRGSGWGAGNFYTLQGYPGDARPKFTASMDFHRVNSLNGQLPQYIWLDNIEIDMLSSGDSHTAVSRVCLYFTMSHLKITNSKFGNVNNQCISGGKDDADLANSGEDFTFQGNEVHHANVFLDTGIWPQPGCGCAPPGCACSTGGYCMYISPANSLITDNTLHDCKAYGMHYFHGGGQTPLTGNTTARNTFFNCATNDGHRNLNVSVIVDHGHDNLYYNNLFYNNGLSVAQVQGNIQFGNLNSNKAYNNTIYNTGGLGVYIASGTGHVVRGNIIYQHAKAATQDDSGGSNTISDNMIDIDPLFADTATADYHLQVGSPARFNCPNFSGIFTTDKDGVSRPSAGTNWACGAYEYASGGAPAAYQVEFGVQPSGEVASAIITPAITVRVENSLGGLITTATDNITLSLVSTQIAQGSLTFVSTDSFNTGFEGAKAIDNNTSTAWHTDFTTSPTGHPHTIVLSFPSSNVNGLRYTPRPGPDTSGQIVGYNVYVSTDGVTWGAAVGTGTLGLQSGGKTYGISLTPKVGSYLKFESTSSLSSTIYASAAELNVMITSAIIPNGTLTQAAVGGIATFTISIPTAGVDYVLKATSGTLQSQLSAPFTITSGTPPPDTIQPALLMRYVPGR